MTFLSNRKPDSKLLLSGLITNYIMNRVCSLSFTRKLSSTTFSSLKTFPLLGSIALITGGSRGIGLAIAQKLSSEGCSCILLSKTESTLQKSVNKLTTVPNSILNENPPNETRIEQKHGYICCDLSAVESIEERLDANLDKLKDVNIVINSAGISQNSLLLRTKNTDIANLINIDLVAPIVLTKRLLKIMLKNKASNKVILNISSILGLRGLSGSAVYSAAKGGLISFTKSMAVEVGSKGIRVNCISPGLVKTEMGIMSSPAFYADKNVLNNSFIDPSEIAEASLFLINQKHITGHNLVIDDGYTIR
ncbi:SDR family NAD(P)-dependent oxidoreductase [Ascoidea rubescens DSM 1968]|uniref:NAD(P)-binding protein n=1 Tax=Ascoidea rubescens DSM 1968 TaxID=1344418 RepID=A0A1D2VFH7_9ASCO|nr:NAD(P)-binding protein [Ascoidea rubescens DSM 1968]ODV60386.1 NAD(P)-binding protein [Ascoidea rubescens DSM 1968]